MYYSDGSSCYGELQHSAIEILLNKICNQSTNLNGITQSRLWKGRHHYHECEECILIILKFPSPSNTMIRMNRLFLYRSYM